MDIMNAGSDLFANLSHWLLTGSNDAFLLVLFLAVFVAVIGGAVMLTGRSTVSRRLMNESIVSGSASGPESLRYNTTDGVWNRLLRAIEKRVPLIDESRRSVMEQRLMQAGYMGGGVLRTYYGLRLFLTLGLPLAFLLISPYFTRTMTTQQVALIAMVLSLAGLYLPSVWISRRISLRRQAIAEGFPDSLDMLVVCVEAGLGLDAAFNRVGAEMARPHPTLATQFALVSLELRAGKSREDALRNMARRIGIEEVSSFVTLLIQSDTLGTSVARTLRVHADEMRAKRTLRAEEKAHKLPVKLTVPLVAFILPCMVTVVLLPGIIRIIRNVIPALTGG